MKKIIALIILFCAVLILPSPSYAAKKFVKKVVSSGGGGGGSLPAIVKYRGDKLGILFSFSNFSGIESVAYSFTYSTNGNPQGAGGVIRAANSPTQQRELLFGTCSTAVCTYHYNLTNARLTMTAKYTNGRTYTKVYKIKTYQ